MSTTWFNMRFYPDITVYACCPVCEADAFASIDVDRNQIETTVRHSIGTMPNERQCAHLVDDRPDHARDQPADGRR